MLLYITRPTCPCCSSGLHQPEKGFFSCFEEPKAVCAQLSLQTATARAQPSFHPASAGRNFREIHNFLKFWDRSLQLIIEINNWWLEPSVLCLAVSFFSRKLAHLQPLCLPEDGSLCPLKHRQSAGAQAALWRWCCSSSFSSPPGENNECAQLSFIICWVFVREQGWGGAAVNRYLSPRFEPHYQCRAWRVWLSSMWILPGRAGVRSCGTDITQKHHPKPSPKSRQFSTRLPKSPEEVKSGHNVGNSIFSLFFSSLLSYFPWFNLWHWGVLYSHDHGNEF